MPLSPELEELSAEAWPRFVRELHRQHIHGNVTIEEREPALEEDDIATWLVVDSAQLLGLSYSMLPQPAVEVAWRTATGGTRSHQAVAPVRIYHARDPYGNEVELRIDRADGGTTLLYFKG